jgi:hypothetical protein
MSVKRSVLVAIATLFAVGGLAVPAANAQYGYGYGQAGYGAGYGYAQAGYGYGGGYGGQVGYGGGCGGGCGGVAYAPITYAQPVAPAQIYVGGCGGGCGMPAPVVQAPCCATMLPPEPAPVPTILSVGNGCGGGCGGGSIFNALGAGFGAGWGGGCNNCAAPVASCCAVPAPAPVACCAAPAPVSPCCGTPAVYTAPAPLYVVNQGPDFNGPGIMEPYRTYAPPAMYAPPPAYPPYPMHRYYPVHHYSPYATYHPHRWAPRYYGRPYGMPTGS